MNFFLHANPASAARLPASALRPPSSHFPTFAPSQIRNPESKIQNLPSPLHLHLNPHPYPLRASRGAAFSLTEVVIALGVATIAFTSIIALFPLGLNMSKESYESTQAALLAQTLMADVKDQQTGTGNKRTSSAPYKTKLIQISENSDPVNVLTNYTTIRMDSTAPQLLYVAYNQLPRNSSDTDPAKSIMLRPVAYSSNLPAWYTAGSNGFFAVAKITVSPTGRFGAASSTSSPMRLDISIETPGSVGVTNRTCYLFTGVARP